MDFIVLDTIHGGTEIAKALMAKGHHVDIVDVYRGTGNTGISLPAGHHFDRVIVPVHLDPDNPVLRACGNMPRLSHHEAVKWIIGNSRPSPMIEITGAQGKTTTAHAIAHILKGPGVLHTSGGTYRFPGKELLFRKSITPASVLSAAGVSGAGDWLVAEESLGVTGAGDLAVITSPLDYRCAAGKKSALALKTESAARAPACIVAPGVKTDIPGTLHIEDYVTVEGDTCSYNLKGISGSFENPLLLLKAYAIPLMTAAAAGCMLGLDPSSLETFVTVQGRMAICSEGGHLIVDNANTGTCRETSIDAAGHARRVSDRGGVVLVIGQESHAVCEGFSPGEVIRTIGSVMPELVILVGDQYSRPDMEGSVRDMCGPVEIRYAGTLKEGRAAAIASPGDTSIVLAVKSWR
jgi:hypothetical protein